MPLRVVVVGGSFGGLTTAHQLRRRLSARDCEITLISATDRFTFIPSLPWVALGRRSLEQISFPLAPALGRQAVSFAQETLLRCDPERRVVVTDHGERPYDVLVLATGHRSANEAVPGLGPGDGPGHSLMSPAEAVELRQALAAVLDDPGPLVIGCAPGASCIGPAYEFAFEVDHLLRRRNRRHRAPITFVTPEPHLGHMGMGGAGHVRRLLEDAFEDRGIRYRTSAAITQITPSAVEVEGLGQLEARLAMVIPPLAGVAAVAESGQLANPKGFVVVDERYRHPVHPDIYAVGVAVALPPVEATPVPVNFPKTGDMTEQMATVAAADIAARAGGPPPLVRDLAARCILDMGDRAVYLSVDPVRPPRRRIPTVSEGRHWLWAKRAFERAYLLSAARGRRLPGGLGW